jgi:hypothetical protein
MADIDHDGDYDLFLGMETGQVYAYRNTGSRYSPAWARHTAWEITGIASDHDSAPVFGDLDLDGDYDLLIGDEEGDLFAYRNTGTNTSPTWSRNTSWELHGLDTDVEPALFDIDEEGGLLPVQIVSFTANLNDGAVELAWSSASEVGSDYYTVERSASGDSWTYVGEVAAAGSSGSFESYTLLDESPLTGDSYYRLIETDVDGRRSVVGRAQVENAATSLTVNITPNPMISSSKIVFTDDRAGSLDVAVVNMMGTEVYSNTIELSPHSPVILPFNKVLLPGSYFMTWSDGTRTGSKVLMVTGR